MRLDSSARAVSLASRTQMSTSSVVPASVHRDLLPQSTKDCAQCHEVDRGVLHPLKTKTTHDADVHVPRLPRESKKRPRNAPCLGSECPLVPFIVLDRRQELFDSGCRNASSLPGQIAQVLRTSVTSLTFLPSFASILFSYFRHVCL